ncbi:unnamed protein product, partial [Polarella glacialis]
DHLTFFLANRDFISPSDLCLLLEGLWSKVVGEHGKEGVTDGKRQLFNNRDFMQIMKDVVFKLERYGPKELPRLLAVLTEMNWHDKHLFKIVEPMTIRHLPAVHVQDLPRLVTSYVTVRCGSRLLFNELVHRCTQASATFKPDALASLVAAFSKSPHKPKMFLIAFGPVVSANLPHFSQEQLGRVVEAYSEWPREVTVDFAEQLTDLLCQDEGAVIRQGLSPGRLVAVLRSLALWRSRSKAARENPKAWRRAMIEEVFRRSAAPLLKGREALTPEEAAAA